MVLINLKLNIMNKFFVILTLMLSCFSLHSQNEIDVEIDKLIEYEKYETVIEKYGKISNDYSYQTLYNIGLSYYMLNNDQNCLNIIDLAIEKDSTKAAPYFIKGSTFSYMDKFKEAIPLLQKAISLESDSVKLAYIYRTIGFDYYHLNKTDLSHDAYLKAIDNENKNPLPYIMIAQLYSKKNNKDKALEYYYLGKENSSSIYEEYITILFNIGLIEQQRGNYKEAQSAYKSLIEINPTDYHTYAKLIQVYNQTKEYDKIPQLKTVLYDAHKKDLIKDENLFDMFCIDQFQINQISIKAFERYEEGDKDRIYNKILFYIIDDNGDIEYRLQTEYSPAAMINKEGKYILCANKNGMHFNYGIVFDDDTSYEAIKNTVIQVLERKIE